jgi:hypothetical protein
MRSTTNFSPHDTSVWQFRPPCSPIFFGMNPCGVRLGLGAAVDVEVGAGLGLGFGTDDEVDATGAAAHPAINVTSRAKAGTKRVVGLSRVTPALLQRVTRLAAKWTLRC